ncbi:MAG: MBL fold metallo-hydrolase, partial [Bacteroidales bacterium]|nr:MBL fold metallo-hydrolase [Bacteroidales bacterium]
MLIKAYFSEDIAHLSYLLIGKSGIFVIDPQRDIRVYEKEIKQRDLPVKGILLTHPHADFISGHREMQEKYQAPVYAHKNAPYHTPVTSIREGDKLELDHIKIDILDTPGHTPFCNSFVITDYSRGDRPVAVFTGDSLFVGDVGRPDLFPAQKEELAGKLYESIFDKLLKLNDFVAVYPAHASGSLCGKNLSEKRATTIG